MTTGGYYGKEKGSVAIIACTNLALFEEVKNFCEKDSESRIAFAGGIKGYEYDTILDMYRLKDGMDIDEDNIELSGITSWDALEKQASNDKNFQLKWKVKVFLLELIPHVCMYISVCSLNIIYMSCI